MGRKPTTWSNLPKGMRARPRGLKIHYYFDTGQKPRREIPLGSDYVVAIQRWAELNAEVASEDTRVVTFVSLKLAYWKTVIPTKAPRTQLDNEKEVEWLLKFFGDPPVVLDQIEPVNVRQYMTWRVEEARKVAAERNAARIKDKRPAIPIDPKIGQVRANREKALFSHMWNYARQEGFTKLPNPCMGIKGFREDGRDVLVSESLLDRLIEKADLPLQFAVRLANVTGQRPADVLRMGKHHICDGVLHVSQGKTRAKLRIVIEGELKNLLEEIDAYKVAVKASCAQLLVNDSGQPLSKHMLRDRFDAAREAAGIEKAIFQFRDLRAKAATEADEAGGTRVAQALLGHTTEGMTASYIRHKVGKKVSPIR